MAKPRKRRAELKAENWVAQMSEECESVPALVWMRVRTMFGLDLRQAPLLSVYELLEPLEHVERITPSLLIEAIDRRVPGIFGL